MIALARLPVIDLDPWADGSKPPIFVEGRTNIATATIVSLDEARQPRLSIVVFVHMHCSRTPIIFVEESAIGVVMKMEEFHLWDHTALYRCDVEKPITSLPWCDLPSTIGDPFPIPVSRWQLPPVFDGFYTLCNWKLARVRD